MVSTITGDKMDREEQNRFLSEEYAEAMRYMDNAKGTLLKAGKDGKHYTDKKYVQTACGTAYNGVLIALNAWFVLKEIPKQSKRKRKSIDYYVDGAAGNDRKLAADLRVAYSVLHLEGYYDGITSIKAIEAGFDAAYDIMERIRPEHPVPVKETKARGVKRFLNNLTTAFAVMFR
jgi:hypothetical protein